MTFATFTRTSVRGQCSGPNRDLNRASGIESRTHDCDSDRACGGKAAGYYRRRHVRHSRDVRLGRGAYASPQHRRPSLDARRYCGHETINNDLQAATYKERGHAKFRTVWGCSSASPEGSAPCLQSPVSRKLHYALRQPMHFHCFT
jgi:hypothetical protein